MNLALKAYEISLSGDLMRDIEAFFKLHNDGETLQHTLKVAAEARKVAGLYDVDPAKAEQAGLLHDISNVIPVSSMLETAKQLSIDILEEELKYERILHQKLSRAMAEAIFNITDKDILSAIECHTTLKPDAALLDKVLFISDKISWELPGDHAYLLEIREQVYNRHLDKGVLIYLDSIWEQRSKLKLVHSWLVQAREQLITVQQTIKFIDEELQQTLKDYAPWFDLNSDVLRYTPRTGWSLEQILEHVTLTSHFLLILIRKGKSKAKELALKANLDQALLNYHYNLGELDEIAKHKSFEWIRPEHMEPRGEKTIAEIKDLLEAQINECRAILKEILGGEGVLYKTTMTVNNLGKIDVYQYIYFLCQHAKRHLVQMQGVKEEFDRLNGAK
ncbi:bis(5'-nucleosyl)-tetraphosphatase (symmetrical) YqeK [Cohnella hashimotonis]|uniref:Bis(5'-nucleosyl)-tetraphosphatase (Symmetrical) YqeK n=1 Tax=Cohnella hashimotonis TaxID=2826895 RepID=A0ABT6TJA0_9BACL|nr:bis(5'-nucleosyl)-tetraphosphatase (symmetrical) YqeK [Cohnella hashimotonis]MDI4646924.1 bis(5'-nucleosyl)-tetraphosphatase (symmetrical) YqeK [Cohnella hashimotonis]